MTNRAGKKNDCEVWSDITERKHGGEMLLFEGVDELV